MTTHINYRTGDVGNCYEYARGGRRLPGCDSLTIAGMVAMSRVWPDTLHEYVGPNGYCTWAIAGREVPEHVALAWGNES